MSKCYCPECTNNTIEGEALCQEHFDLYNKIKNLTQTFKTMAKLSEDEKIKSEYCCDCVKGCNCNCHNVITTMNKLLTETLIAEMVLNPVKIARELIKLRQLNAKTIKENLG